VLGDQPFPRRLPFVLGATASFLRCKTYTAAPAFITVTSASDHANPVVAPTDREFIAI
jgi:hypothetical protein